VLAGPSASVYNISISDANDEAKEMAKKTGPDSCVRELGFWLIKKKREPKRKQSLKHVDERLGLAFIWGRGSVGFAYTGVTNIN